MWHSAWRRPIPSRSCRGASAITRRMGAGPSGNAGHPASCPDRRARSRAAQGFERRRT